MDKEILRKFGLSDQEIDIYLTLLRLKESTATKIAYETNIDRATTYRFLSSLIAKGLASHSIKNNVKYFNAAHPSKLTQDLKDRLKQLQEIMPDLEGLVGLPKEETKVELYKGKEGLKTIMNDILREERPYTFVGEVEKIFEELPIFIEHWLKNIEKSRIKGKLICNENARFIVAKTERYRLISKDFISLISTWTYGKKTALFIWSKPLFGILINNEDVTKSNLELFNFLWKLAKAPSRKHSEILPNNL